MAVALAAAIPQAVAAQGLGSLLKKAKKTVETVTGTISADCGAVAIESGGTIQNPIAKDVEIVPVGLYGIGTSENYGNVYFVLKVKMNLNRQTIGFGCVNGGKAVAIDCDGNVYNIDASGHFNHDVAEGSFVTLRLDNPGLVFLDVKKNVKMMQQVKLGVFIDQEHQGVITFKDIPVRWDERF